MGASELKYLRHYLDELTALLQAQGDEAPTMQELRDAYALSVCDFARWLAGCGWHGLRQSMLRRCKVALDAIDADKRWMTEDEYTEAVLVAFPIGGEAPKLSGGNDVAHAGYGNLGG